MSKWFDPDETHAADARHDTPPVAEPGGKHRAEDRENCATMFTTKNKAGDIVNQNGEL